MNEIFSDNVKIPGIAEYIRLSRKAIIRGLIMLIPIFSIFFFSFNRGIESGWAVRILVNILYGSILTVIVGSWNLLKQYHYLKKTIISYRSYREEVGDKLSLWLSVGGTPAGNSLFYMNLLCEYNKCIYGVRPGSDIILLCTAKPGTDLKKVSETINRKYKSCGIALCAYGLFLKIKNPQGNELMGFVDELYQVFDREKEILQPIKMR